MTRPRGTFSGFRAGLLQAAGSLAAERGGVTWRDLVPPMFGADRVAPSELKLVRNTYNNALRAGDLVPVGTVAVPGSSRPMTLCVPAADHPHVMCGAVRRDASAELAEQLRGWAGFR